MSHDIFISYSRDDQERMKLIRESLETSGLTVWTDTGIKPGTESWKQDIATAIKGCRALVVLFSPDAAQSTWVNRELDYAELHNKKIYPLLVRGSEAEAVPFGYTTYQFIDIRDDAAVGDGIVALLTAMQGSLLETSNMPVVRTPTDVTQTLAAPVAEVREALEEDPDTPRKVLWQWVDRPGFSMTVPATWKVLEPTEDSLRKMQFIMSGKDDNLFYRIIEDNVEMGYMLTRIKGMEYQHRFLISDMSGMTPIGIFVTDLIPPAYFRFADRTVPLLKGFFRRRIESFWKERYNAEITEFQTSRTNEGLMFQVTGHTLATASGEGVIRGRAYVLIPRGARRWTVILLSTEVSRFDAEVDVYDRIARSMQIEE